MSIKRLACFFAIVVCGIDLQAAELLNPITVTASRTAVSAKEVGSSVAAISTQEISNRQVPFVSSLLRDVPGTAISQNGGAGTFTQLRLRGAEANQTLVLIDGIEANDIAAGSEFDFGNLLTCGLERIEILRGPQSSLWGSDALAGVVSVQTKKGAGPLQIENTFSGGGFDTRQNCAGITAGNERYHLSAFASFFENNGTNISEQGSEDDGYRNTAINIRYGLNPLDNLQFALAGRHVDAAVETDPFDPPIDADRETQNIQNYLHFSSILDTFDGHWTHQFNIGVTDTDNEFFANGMGTNSTKGEKLKLDYQSNVLFSVPELANSEHVFTVVLERERERFEQAGEVTSFGDPNQRQKIYSTGYVGEYRVGFSEQLYLSASLRHDDNDEFKDRTTHRYSLAYAPENTSSRFHAAYGTGIKNPAFTDRFGFTPDTFIGNPNIKPEKSTGWEIGFAHIFSHRLRVEAIYFAEKLEDEINGFFFDSSLGNFTATNLSGKSRRKGVELSFHTRVSEDLHLRGAYTYVDAKEPALTGRASEIRRPRNVASLIGNYRFLAGKANLNVRINYTDEQFDTNFTTFERVALDDYTLVNIAGEYRLNNWMALEGRIENLLNKSYQDIFGYETQGFNAHVGIKLLGNL